MRKNNITKIIHETYVKEIIRFNKKQDEDRRKREESEERKIAEAELAMQQELAALEEEKARNERIAKRAAAKNKQASVAGNKGMFMATMKRAAKRQ